MEALERNMWELRVVRCATRGTYAVVCSDSAWNEVSDKQRLTDWFVLVVIPL